MEKLIIPAIIAKSQAELEERIDKVRDHAKVFQLDVMDGRFVPNQSLNFDFILPSELEFEAHLMIQNPEQWVETHWEMVRTILAHVESCRDPERMLDLRERRRVGFALNPQTPLNTIEKYLDRIDQVLIMTVNPGFYGSPFLPETLKKVAELRRMSPSLNIEVDGGIGADTIRQVNDAGANMFVSGSYLMKSKNTGEAVQVLRHLLGA